MHDIVEDNPLIEGASGDAERVVDLYAIRDLVRVPQVLLAESLKELDLLRDAPVTKLDFAFAVSA